MRRPSSGPSASPSGRPSWSCPCATLILRFEVAGLCFFSRPWTAILQVRPTLAGQRTLTERLLPFSVAGPIRLPFPPHQGLQLAVGQALTRCRTLTPPEPSAVFCRRRRLHAQRDVVEADARGATSSTGGGDRRARFGRDRERVGMARLDGDRVVFAGERRACADGLRKDFRFGPRGTVDQVDRVGGLRRQVDQRPLDELPIQVQRAVPGAGDREVGRLQRDSRFEQPHQSDRDVRVRGDRARRIAVRPVVARPRRCRAPARCRWRRSLPSPEPHR